MKKIPCREKSGNLEKMGKIREFYKNISGNFQLYMYILIVLRSESLLVESAILPDYSLYSNIYPGKWGNYQGKIREFVSPN